MRICAVRASLRFDVKGYKVIVILTKKTGTDSAENRQSVENCNNGINILFYLLTQTDFACIIGIAQKLT
jgi:hypothetical protein